MGLWHIFNYSVALNTLISKALQTECVFTTVMAEELNVLVRIKRTLSQAFNNLQGFPDVYLILQAYYQIHYEFAQCI